jgi:hypothetical protein
MTVGMCIDCESQSKQGFVRSDRRWEDNIKMELRETWWEGVHCIHLAQDRDQWYSYSC